MNRNGGSFVRRARKLERGQVVLLMLFMMVGLLGMAAMSVDVGVLYVSYRELQASTDAAALAGAQGLPNTTATTTATAYSAVAGGMNTYTNLPNVAMVSGYPKAVCLTTLTNEGIPCVAPANANAMAVKQQVNVPMTFARVLGIDSLSITARATAAMRGSSVAPYNVMIVVDTTDSMNDTDSDSACSSTRISCALAGVRALLSDLSPCLPSQTSCGAVTGGNVAYPVDTVGLMVFPGLTSTSQVQYEYDCSNSPNPTIAAYTASPLPTYQIVPFSSDYRASDTATSLRTNSNVVLASQGVSSCSQGMAVVGGVGTFYAGVITAAQSALVTAAASRPNSKNVLILLSDGDANATAGNLSGYQATQQCHQAVTAAQNATAAGTRVYAVAYGSAATGCSTDTNPPITPCQTMQQIASSSGTFFSDYTATGGDTTCVSASRPVTNLNEIFTEIAGDLTVSRLIPDNLP
jgi:Flp pilus assembly protein TadG